MEPIKNIIPNDITISEQYFIRKQFINQIYLCFGIWADRDKVDVKELLERSGVYCFYVGEKLSGFYIMNPDKYTWWLLEWY
jgi:hypothetical protein